MTFTLYQRLNLYNQYIILEKLSRLQEESNEADAYAQKAKIVKNGFSFDYSECTETIQDELSETDCKLVWDTLNMYSVIISSYQNLETPGLSDEDVLFHGFDGNNEHKFLDYCEYILFDLKCFAELTANGRKSFNSHSQLCERYRAMIRRWDEMDHPHQLTEEQIKILINTKA